MKRYLALAVLFPALCAGLRAADKARVVVLTDIENEPDDAQSMVRFLAYSNRWDVEALIATTSLARSIANGRSSDPGESLPSPTVALPKAGRPSLMMDNR